MSNQTGSVSKYRFLKEYLYNERILFRRDSKVSIFNLSYRELDMNQKRKSKKWQCSYLISILESSLSTSLLYEKPIHSKNKRFGFWIHLDKVLKKRPWA